MIKSIQYLIGYPLTLPCVQSKKFEFKDGINVLFGANASGKSTILNTLKGYCAIKTGGWTQPTNPAETGVGRMGGADYPHCYSSFTPSQCQAAVIWDGTPTFYNNGDIKVNETFFYHKVGQSDDGITSEAEQFDALVNKPSSGQFRTEKLNKIFSILGSGAPKYSERDRKEVMVKVDEVWTKREIDYWSYINNLYRQMYNVSKSTVLFDEPDRSLSLPKQKTLFLELIPQHLKEYQVIIATHSPFALFTPDANIIEMEEGYAASCIEALKNPSAQS